MSFDWLDYAIGSATGAAIIAFLGFLFRDTVARYFSKSIEHRFDAKLEKVKSTHRQREIEISAELASKDRELHQITSFLTDSRRERDVALQAKRMLGAEAALNQMFVLSKNVMAVEMMKYIKYDEFCDWAKKHPAEYNRFLEILKLDDALFELNPNDQMLMILYLPETVYKHFSAFKLITTIAIMKLKAAGFGRGQPLAFKSDALASTVIELAPTSEEGFQKYGDDYGFYWRQYFYDNTTKLLRETVTGVEQGRLDTIAAADIAVSSEIARSQAAASLAEIGLPSQVLHSEREVQGLESARKGEDNRK